MSRTDLPPVPSAGRGKQPAGHGHEDARIDRPDPMAKRGKPTARNLASQGRQGNIKQNTTHSGHQQDR